MIHDPDELGHDKYNSNFSVHSHLTLRKHTWEVVQLDLLLLTGTKVAEWNIYCKLRKEDSSFVP